MIVIHAVNMDVDGDVDVDGDRDLASHCASRCFITVLVIACAAPSLVHPFPPHTAFGLLVSVVLDSDRIGDASDLKIGKQTG